MGKKRPWLVMAYSHEHEWNGRVGRRFSTEGRARSCALHWEAEGYFDVRVVYNEVRPVAVVEDEQ